MYIGRVVGNVVATRKEESLVGQRFLIVQKVDKNENAIGEELVAVDYIGAGKGEIVLISTGSGARSRDDESYFNKPIDLAIVGIIDEVQ